MHQHHHQAFLVVAAVGIQEEDLQRYLEAVRLHLESQGSLIYTSHTTAPGRFLSAQASPPPKEAERMFAMRNFMSEAFRISS